MANSFESTSMKPHRANQTRTDSESSVNFGDVPLDRLDSDLESRFRGRIVAAVDCKRHPRSDHLHRPVSVKFCMPRKITIVLCRTFVVVYSCTRSQSDDKNESNSICARKIAHNPLPLIRAVALYNCNPKCYPKPTDRTTRTCQAS